MAGTENLEQELLGDIIKIRSTLETSWDDIKANTATISAILGHMIKQLNGLSASSVEQDFENVVSEIESTLSDINLDYLKAGLSDVEQEFATTIDSLLKGVDSLESDTIVDIFEKVLNEVSGLDGLPADIQRAIEPIERIVKTILGSDFSLALKDLPDHQSSGGSDSGNKKQAAQAGVSLFESLSADIESAISTLTDGTNPFKTLESSIKALAKSQLTGLEGNVIATLAALIADLEGHGPGGKIPLSLQLIIDNLESLLETEKAQVTTTLTDLSAQVKDAFDAFQTIVNKFKDIELNPDSELYELFALLLPDVSTPKLIDLVSLVIAIPLTLTLESTGKNPIITNPYTKHNDLLSLVKDDADAVVSGETSLYINGSLQLASVEFAVIDKFVDYYYDDKGSATPYQWKVFKTLFSSACTATAMSLSAPISKNPFTNPTLSSSVWLSQLFTSLGFGFVKGMTDAYQTRKVAQIPPDTDFAENHKILTDNFSTFYKETGKRLTNFYLDYSNLSFNKGKSKRASSVETLTNSSFYKEINQLNDHINGLKTEVDLEKTMEKINNFQFPDPLSQNVYDQLNSRLKKLKAKKKLNNSDKTLKLELTTFERRLENLPGTYLQPGLVTLQQSISGIEISKTLNKTKAKKDKILSRNFTAVGLLFQVYNSVINSYLYKTSHPDSEVTFSLNLAVTVPDIVDSISGLSWYVAASKNPLTATQKKVKKYIGYGTFFIGKSLTIASAIMKFVKAGEGAQIQSATYDFQTNILTVKFENEVTLVSGKSITDCFVISGAGISIKSASPTGNSDTYQLTIQGDLILPATIEVASSSLKNPAGDDITPQKVSIFQV